MSQLLFKFLTFYVIKCLFFCRKTLTKIKFNIYLTIPTTQSLAYNFPRRYGQKIIACLLIRNHSWRGTFNHNSILSHPPELYDKPVKLNTRKPTSVGKLRAPRSAIRCEIPVIKARTFNLKPDDSPWNNRTLRLVVVLCYVTSGSGLNSQCCSPADPVFCSVRRKNNRNNSLIENHWSFRRRRFICIS